MQDCCVYVDGECWNAVLAAQLNYPIFNAPPSASMQTLTQLLALKALSRGITGMAMSTTKKKSEFRGHFVIAVNWLTNMKMRAGPH